jgi:hypothetical protein
MPTGKRCGKAGKALVVEAVCLDMLTSHFA